MLVPKLYTVLSWLKNKVWLSPCAIVYAWGNGENGSLGNGVDANSILPVLVGSEEVQFRLILGLHYLNLSF